MGASELSDPKTGVAASELERPTWVRYQVLIAACGLAVITYMHRVGFSTASTQLQKPLGLNDQHVGYMMAVFMLAYGLFEVPWGLLGDRLGVRNLLAIIVLGGSLLTAAIPLVVLLPEELAWRLGFLLLLRFLFGMFQAGTFPVLSRMIADWLPITERGLAQGFIWTSSRIGGALVPRLLVALFVMYGTWTPLVIVAGLGLAWCALFWPWFRNQPAEMAQVNAAERKLILAGRAPRTTHALGHVPWSSMAGSLSVWSLCWMYGFLGYSGNFFLTLLPAYLENHRHLSQQTASWMQALPFACGVIACVSGGHLSDVIIKRSGTRKWGRRLVGSFGLSLAALAILSTIWVSNPILLGVLLCLTFTGNDLAMGPAWAAVADIGERYAGTLGGTMNMLASFTAAVAALVTGYLFQRHLIILPFVIFSASYGLGALCWMGVDVTRTLVEEEDR